MSQIYVAIDLETTGLDASRDAIIEVAALRFDASGELEVFDSLVRPEIDLSVRSQQLTGLSAADLAKAPRMEAVLPALAEFVAGAQPVGHSVDHDLRFLAARGLRFEQPGLDTFELATMLVPECDRYSLANLIDLLELEDVDPTHRALADARAHHRLFLALQDRARRLPAELLTRICSLAEGQDWPAAKLFREALADPLPADPGSEDRALIAEALAAPVPPQTEHAALEEFDIDALEALIAPGGAMDARSEGFEDRPGQRDMLRQVAETLASRDHLLIEAGTGTGKSLAYLLPAAAMARASRRPVVIATHTIALQQQLMDKDIPLAAELLGGTLRVALLKGRANYLCRGSLERMATRGDLELDQIRAVVKLLIWSRVTETGDRSELLLQPEERETWAELNAQAGCTPESCPYAAAGSCWVHRARARAAGAELIVTNHALLASDMHRGQSLLLPPYAHLIIDEAHHLEAVATDALTLRIGRRELERQLAAIHGLQGAPARAARALARLTGETADVEPLATLSADVRAMAEGASPDIAAFLAALEDFYIELAGKGAREARLSKAARGRSSWLMVETEWDSLHDRLLRLEEGLATLARRMARLAEDLGGARGGELGPTAAAIRSARRRLDELRQQLEMIVARPDPSQVTWLTRKGPGRLSLHAAPLDVGYALSKDLFAGRAVVLTSATLRAGYDFAFIRERLCLPDAPARAVAPAFDYASAVLLCTPPDVPPPGQSGYQRALGELVADLARTLGGRTLVLYTSYSALRQTYHMIRRTLGESGIAVIAQGIDGTRHQLLTAFKDPEAPTVLLGTRSFWEGIDVPGPALSALVITRLPFDVPSDPIFQARAEAYDDPFGDFALPLGVLRFRQGFGRLIRSARDRGVAVIFDSRIHSKNYGPLFLDALPPCRHFEGRAAEVPMAAANFLAGRPEPGIEGMEEGGPPPRDSRAPGSSPTDRGEDA